VLTSAVSSMHGVLPLPLAGEGRGGGRGGEAIADVVRGEPQLPPPQPSRASGRGSPAAAGEEAEDLRPRIGDEAPVEWSDIAIVLGARRHGEANAVAELMTREHGRHLGLVRGGAGTRLKPVLQAGNRVSATWRARLDEHLGYYVVEAIDLRAAGFLATAHALYGLNHLAALCRLLPERDPHAPVFDRLDTTLARLAEPLSAAALVARFELELLAELGFGLDLDACAVTGNAADLVYVSPKSGRAVSKSAGEPWHDRLLPLPAFLSDEGPTEGLDTPTPEALEAGFALTGFFLARHVFEPRGEPLPQGRQQFIAAVTRASRQPPERSFRAP
jgi:DNA repair protein RecO (recombination protein O)